MGNRDATGRWDKIQKNSKLLQTGKTLKSSLKVNFSTKWYLLSVLAYSNLEYSSEAKYFTITSFFHFQYRTY